VTGRIVKEPIYQQLSGALRQVLCDGKFNPGQRFWTEREVCSRYDVSRATANKALANLVSEGLLEFRKGVGTFVRGGLLGADLQSLVSFTAQARAAGQTPETKVLALRRTTNSAEIDWPGAGSGGAAGGPRHLWPASQPDTPLWYTERLRLVADRPVILERRYIDATLCPDLTEADLAGSLYALWTDRFELHLGGANQAIRAVCLRGPDAAMLGSDAGAAALLVVAVGTLATGQPLWHERTLYRGDAYELHNRIGGSAPASPAQGALAGDPARAIMHTSPSAHHSASHATQPPSQRPLRSTP
jgi:GntR family transcriptional regulator